MPRSVKHFKLLFGPKCHSLFAILYATDQHHRTLMRYIPHLEQGYFAEHLMTSQFSEGFCIFFSLFVFYLLWSNLVQNDNSEYPIVYIVYQDGNKIRSKLLITLLVYWTDLLTKSNRRYKYVKYNISRYIIGTLECYIASKHPFVALNIVFSAHILFQSLNSSLLSILYQKKSVGAKMHFYFK